MNKQICQQENIPPFLQGFKRWMIISDRTLDKKTGEVKSTPGDKAPKSLKNPTINASFIKGPFHSFSDALEAVKSGSASGLGLCHSDGNSICTIDLDRCYSKGKLTEYAQKIVDLVDSYTEFGKSKTGLHLVFLRPGFNGRKLQANGKQKKAGKEFELFTANGFVILTGDVFGENKPVRTLDSDEMKRLMSLLKDKQPDIEQQQEESPEADSAVDSAVDSAGWDGFEEYCNNNQKQWEVITGHWTDSEKLILWYFSEINQGNRDNIIYRALVWWWEEHPTATKEYCLRFTEKLWGNVKQVPGDIFTLDEALAKVDNAKKKADLGKKARLEKMIMTAGRVKRLETTDADEVIHVVVSQDIAGMAENLIIKVGHWLFNKGGVTVAVTGRKQGSRRLEQVSKSQLEARLTNEIRFIKMTATKPPQTVACPPKLAEYLVGIPDILKPVERISHRPAFNSKWELINSSGLQGKTFFDLPDELEGLSVPTKPNENQVNAAYNFLVEDHFIHQFPFSDQSSKLTALSCLLTFFVRDAINGQIPAYLFQAPTPGAGKTLLASSIIQAGEGSPAVQTMPATGEEQNRAIISSLLTGQMALFLDNLNRSFKSGNFAALMTSETFSGKILYRAEQFKTKNNLIPILTANGLELNKDLARRSAFISLSQKDQNERHDVLLLPWTRSNLAEIVRSALTLVAAWISVGQPSIKRTLPSFESWSYIIGGIIDTIHPAGWKLMMDGRKIKADIADSESEMMEELFNFIVDKFGTGRAFNASSVLKSARYDAREDELFPEYIKTPVALGRLFHRYIDAIFGGMKLEKMQTRGMYKILIID